MYVYKTAARVYGCCWLIGLDVNAASDYEPLYEPPHY